MSDTLFYIKTYACPNCPYKQLHDPTDATYMAQVFWEDKYKGLQPGKCPACYAGENPQRTKLDSGLELLSGPDLSVLSQTTVASDTTLAGTQVPDLDANGQQIMVQVGEHYEMQIDQSTGAVSSVLIPDYAPQTRSLTTDELTALQNQRNQNLDALAPVTVSETTT